MLSCREVTRLVASEAIARAGFLTRIALRFHLMICRHCRGYVRQVEKMGAVARDLQADGRDDADDVERPKATILEASRKAADAPDPGA